MARPVCYALTLVFFSACARPPGDNGTKLDVELTRLGGGVIFATSAIPGSNGYDLYWSPVPELNNGVPQPYIALTNADGDEVQPGISKNGDSLVYAKRGTGIFYVNALGEISQISNTEGTRFIDTLPSVSLDGSKVAWVREDLNQPFAGTGFFQAFIVLANADGTEARAIAPSEGTIQDSPVFEPVEGSTRLAWSEFLPASIDNWGPTKYGIRVFDYALETGNLVCTEEQTTDLSGRGWPYRCFGQHLDWPKSGALQGLPESATIVATQDLLELNTATQGLATTWPAVVGSLSGGPNPPVTGAAANGFFPNFPISATFADGRMFFDGVLFPIDGDFQTLAFFVARETGAGAVLFPIIDRSGDLDIVGTNNYFFSLARPQLVPRSL